MRNVGYSKRYDERRNYNRSKCKKFEFIIQYLISSLQLHINNIIVTKFKLIGTLIMLMLAVWYFCRLFKRHDFRELASGEKCLITYTESYRRCSGKKTK